MGKVDDMLLIPHGDKEGEKDLDRNKTAGRTIFAVPVFDGFDVWRAHGSYGNQSNATARRFPPYGKESLSPGTRYIRPNRMTYGMSSLKFGAAGNGTAGIREAPLSDFAQWRRRGVTHLPDVADMEPAGISLLGGFFETYYRKSKPSMGLCFRRIELPWAPR